VTNFRLQSRAFGDGVVQAQIAREEAATAARCELSLAEIATYATQLVEALHLSRGIGPADARSDGVLKERYPVVTTYPD
jgi:hypothetical protein